MMGPTEEHSTIWEGIALQITWCPGWFQSKRVDYSIAHLEVRSETGEPLPISETGYRSHFLPREAVEEYDGPVEYVKAWLSQDAGKPAWKAYLEESRQGSLF